jgi:hypothetical protein
VRRLLAVGIVVVAVLPLGALRSDARPSSPVILGNKNVVMHGIGWGTQHPSVIFNGGDPSGRAWNLRWSDWGDVTAEAHGLTWVSGPHGGYNPKPAAIELRASHIGRCDGAGALAYTRLEARERTGPGRPLGPWFVWGNWQSICRGP